MPVNTRHTSVQRKSIDMTLNSFDPQDIDLIMTNVKAKTAQEVLEIISQEVSIISSLTPTTIFTRLLQKEKEQSSGTGNGVALPHMRLINANKPISILMTLAEKIDFNAADNMPVDIVYLLISPRADGTLHLQRLSTISRILKNEILCNKMRKAKNADDLRDLMTATPPNGLTLAA